MPHKHADQLRPEGGVLGEILANFQLEGEASVLVGMVLGSVDESYFAGPRFIGSDGRILLTKRIKQRLGGAFIAIEQHP